MIFPLRVGLQVVFAFKPFCALDAVVSPETREVLRVLGGLVLRKMLWRTEILSDLIVVSIGCDVCQKLYSARRPVGLL